ncbi:MAG: NAD-dependent epimerase/dehydratase family protein [Acidobacteria bacterium]|nr:NAD-dependent epimerase/dehydratase family protein [Acidobacteriota bacterium]
MTQDARIFVAGHGGLVGTALMRRLHAERYDNVLTATREQLDLRDQAAVNYWFRATRPECVFLVAGTVGGIMANSTRPGEFIIALAAGIRSTYEWFLAHKGTARGLTAGARS